MRGFVESHYATLFEGKLSNRLLNRRKNHQLSRQIMRAWLASNFLNEPGWTKLMRAGTMICSCSVCKDSILGRTLIHFRPYKLPLHTLFFINTAVCTVFPPAVTKIHGLQLAHTEVTSVQTCRYKTSCPDFGLASLTAGHHKSPLVWVRMTVHGYN